MMDMIDYCTVCSVVVHTDCNKSHPVINTDTYTCFSEACSSTTIKSRRQAAISSRDCKYCLKNFSKNSDTLLYSE